MSCNHGQLAGMFWFERSQYAHEQHGTASPQAGKVNGVPRSRTAPPGHPPCGLLHTEQPWWPDPSVSMPRALLHGGMSGTVA